MTLGIMQPYLFPYIGYFQLIQAVDKFVVYDDVSYIKQGWINRNRLLLNGSDYIFTVPLKKASSFDDINKTGINKALYVDWKKKFFKTLAQSYMKAPYYASVLPLLEGVLEMDAENIGVLATSSIQTVCEYLGIFTPFVTSSVSYNNDNLSAYNRVIDICKKEAADTYINPIGGQELYDKDIFKQHDLELYFIKSKPVAYPQFKNAFVPWLSIIDLLMFLPAEKIRELVLQYDLV